MSFAVNIAFHPFTWTLHRPYIKKENVSNTTRLINYQTWISNNMGKEHSFE